MNQGHFPLKNFLTERMYALVLIIKILFSAVLQTLKYTDFRFVSLQ